MSKITDKRKVLYLIEKMNKTTFIVGANSVILFIIIVVLGVEVSQLKSNDNKQTIKLNQLQADYDGLVLSTNGQYQVLHDECQVNNGLATTAIDMVLKLNSVDLPLIVLNNDLALNNLTNTTNTNLANAVSSLTIANSATLSSFNADIVSLSSSVSSLNGNVIANGAAIAINTAKIANVSSTATLALQNANSAAIGVTVINTNLDLSVDVEVDLVWSVNGGGNGSSVNTIPMFFSRVSNMVTLKIAAFSYNSGSASCSALTSGTIPGAYISTFYPQIPIAGFTVNGVGSIGASIRIQGNYVMMFNANGASMAAYSTVGIADSITFTYAI